jgi:hypothetical protein
MSRLVWKENFVCFQKNHYACVRLREGLCCVYYMLKKKICVFSLVKHCLKKKLDQPGVRPPHDIVVSRRRQNLRTSFPRDAQLQIGKRVFLRRKKFKTGKIEESEFHIKY